MDKIVEVSGCGDCPFGWFGAYLKGNECFHPKNQSPHISREFIPHNYFEEENQGSPSWCPLKVNSITTKLKENG